MEGGGKWREREGEKGEGMREDGRRRNVERVGGGREGERGSERERVRERERGSGWGEGARERQWGEGEREREREWGGAERTEWGGAERTHTRTNKPTSGEEPVNLK